MNIFAPCVVRTEDLVQETWRFYMDDITCTFYLDLYTYEERATKRHKFQVTKIWSRLSHNRYHSKNLTFAEVPLPDNVLVEARAQVISKITVTNTEWKTRGGRS